MCAESERTEKRGRTPSRVIVDRRLLPKRILVASNRLPYRIEVENGDVKLERGMGGLVTALDPVLRSTGGLWFGWTGSYSPVPESVEVEEEMGGSDRYELHPLSLTEEEVQRYYLGYANKTIWPLFHYFQEHSRFDDEYWKTYVSVNRKFAGSVIDAYREGDFIWIHDYHLMLVPNMIRRELPGASIGFFLHIPFPAPEVFRINLRAGELLEGLLGADLIGFHTSGYARNFLRTASDRNDGRYSVTDDSVRTEDREVKVGAFPISIDAARFAGTASAEGIEERVKAIRDTYRADILAVGVDRLDYTKGILERLIAIETMLERHPDIQGNFTFIQLSAPSRTKVDTYRSLREQIELMVGRINGRFGGRGCIPVDYRYEGHPQERLIEYYRAADICLVTPLRDGMNLVAKEYVASRVDDGGALVLSRFTGARHELSDAVLVNPYHPRDTAEGIYRAIQMPAEKRRRSMRRMREVVDRNDIYWWLEQFLRARHETVRGD